MTSIAHDLANTIHDVTLTIAYNPAGQITTRTVSNDVYVYDDLTSTTTDYAIDGLNRIAAVETTPLTSMIGAGRSPDWRIC